jgi:PncC family amidohydrolase
MSIPIEKRIGELLTQHNLTISTAESCTGGLIGHKITNIPGSSNYFAGSAVVYSNEAKINLLDVQPATIDKFGAVSRQTVTEMAAGVRKLFKTDIGLAVSGIAGPDGGTDEKPVGLIWIAINLQGYEDSWDFDFQGNRLQIKEKTAQKSLDLLETLIQSANQHPEDTTKAQDRQVKNLRFKNVEVWGFFDRNGNLTPKGFIYQDKEYEIQMISRKWQFDDDLHFLVMVPINRVYELIFKSQEKRWVLRNLNSKPEAAA